MDESAFDVAVIGLGYIGLPTAATFATHGKRVAGVDVKATTVDAVNAGQVPFVEPDLGTILSGAVSLGNLVAFTEVPEARAYIVAVPTPVTQSKGVDLVYLNNAADALAPRLHGGELIIVESTSPPGTTELFGERIVAARPDLSLYSGAGKPVIHVAHSPERVLPGRIMIEIVTNDRVVGGLSPEAGAKAKELYEVICRGAIHVTDAKTAELAKIAENSFRDVNIAFANQLSLICRDLDIDVWRLVELANHHPRVNILNPGPGVGGHCIAVDPWFLVNAFPDVTALTRAGRDLNDSMPRHVVQGIVERLNGRQDAKVALLGLAFKANVDDTRESPAIEVVKLLADAVPDARLYTVEPHVSELPHSLRDTANVQLSSLRDAVQDADMLVLLVDHDHFRTLDMGALSGKTVIDTKGFWRQAGSESLAAAIPAVQH